MQSKNRYGGLVNMSKMQADVEQFHRALDIPVGDSPSIRRPELRTRLILEEALETCKAMTGREIDVIAHKVTGEPNLIEAIDGMCDLLVVTFGTAVEFGVNIDPFWDEVHRSNMAKVGGETRADGKKLKPPNWKPPELERIFKEVYG